MRAAIGLTVLLSLFQGSPTDSPAAAAEALLAADRAFAVAAADRTTVAALSAMFADDVTMPAPGNVFVQGRAAAVAALKSTADNVSSRVVWRPLRAGVSADGLHGFTFGYMTMTKADGADVPMKYLAYWVKGAEGWRVAAYRRRPRPAGEVSLETVPPSVPERMVEPSTDAAGLALIAASLTAAEQRFSDEAQTLGLGRAFAKFGRPDAVNMGGAAMPGFVFGAEAIGSYIGRNAPADRSEVEWSADRVLVASSGDLGITFGTIRSHKTGPDRPDAVPFFTIWRRDGPSAPWRYIAE